VDDYAKIITGLLPNRADEADSLSRILLLEVSTLPESADSLKAKAFYLMGIVQYYRSQFVLAEKYYQAALEIPHAKQKIQLRENCLNNLGVIYDRQNRIDEAIEVYLESLNIAESRNDSFAMVQTWINMVILEFKQNNYDRALALGKLTLDYSTRHKDSLNMGLSHANLALVYNKLKDTERLFFHTNEGRSIFKAIENEFESIGVLISQASHYRDLKQVQKAEALLKEAEYLTSKTKNWNMLANVYLENGHLAVQKGSAPEVALRYYLDAENICKKHGIEELFGEIYLGISGLYAKTGKYDAYVDAINRYEDYLQDKNRKQSASTYEQIRAFYELDKLMSDKQKLEKDINERNRQLLLTSLLVAFLLITSGVITYFFLRLRRYAGTLFRLNLEDAQQNQLLRHAEHKRPAESEIPDTDAQPVYERYQELIHVLVEEKLFLDPDLNIQLLATRMATNQKYVSQAINEYSGTNFFGLMRRFRVNEARKLIISTLGKCNLQDVSDQSGFSNRSSFSRQFKEVTGFSPSEFQNLVARNPDYEDMPPDDYALTIEKP
jgi:AraC-like DNA-binding protein